MQSLFQRGEQKKLTSKKIQWVLRSATILAVVMLVGVSLNVFYTHSAKAATTDTTDVQYSTILDWSASNVLLEQGGYVATSTYNCSVASLACAKVPSSIQSLTPSVLANATGYFLSTDETLALVATYVANSNPIETLDSTQGNVLTAKVTLPKLNSLVTNVRWSGDNNVLLISESDGSLQKYVVSTKTLTTLTSTIPSGASWVTTSPDGRYVAYYIPAPVSTGKRQFGVIDTTLDTTYTLNETIDYWDLLSEGVRVFAFSPDSTKLLYLDDRSEYQTLYEVNLSQLNPTEATSNAALDGTQITAKKYSIEDMQWVDNSNIVFSANRSTPLQWSLYELNLNTYAISTLTDWMAYDAPMEKIGSDILFQTADANGRITKIFNTLTKTISTFNVPEQTDSIVGTTNQIVQEDGLAGVYMAPPATAAATSTLLVWLHGGPDRQDSIEYNSYQSYGGYDWVLNQVNNAGVPVLKLDYPGSLGYGTAFAESIKGGVGTVDASETMKAISDFATAHGYKNVYVMGNSYGGYLALKLLVTYPSQIKGVFSLSGVTDWQSLLTNVPNSIFSIDFNGAPNATNQALYDKASILNNISAIGNQKVIIVQGNADTEVPYQQSVILDNALVAANKNVEYYTLPGEDHIYENPSSYTLTCNKALELVGLPSSSLCTMK